MIPLFFFAELLSPELGVFDINLSLGTVHNLSSAAANKSKQF